MQVRRSLATVLAVGSILLATGCADDEVSGSPEGDATTSGAADKGPVSISGQSFPEAALVASMYEQLLTDAGYSTDVKLVDARDAYMATFPDSIDVVPEYVGGIVNFLNAAENGENAKPLTAGDGQELADAGQGPAGREGHHPARPVRGDRHQRLLRHPGVLRERGRHQALRPRGHVREAGGGAPTARTPRLRGRPVRRVRHRRDRGAPARLRQRPDLPGGARRRDRARGRPAPPTAPWRRRAWSSSRTTSRSSRRRTSCPRSATPSWRRTPTSRRS